MNIGELAQKSGFPPSTIRYYEEQGLLAPAERRPNGYRDYTDRAMRQLQIVRHCQSLGFTLETIRGFFSGDGGCDHVKVLAQIAARSDAVRAEQAALDAQLTQLAALKAMLENETARSAACT